MAAWVGEAFVAACVRVWLAGRSCYENVDALWEVFHYGWGEAVGVEWESSVPMGGGVRGEESGVSSLQFGYSVGCGSVRIRVNVSPRV